MHTQQVSDRGAMSILGAQTPDKSEVAECFQMRFLEKRIHMEMKINYVGMINDQIIIQRPSPLSQIC